MSGHDTPEVGGGLSEDEREALWSAMRRIAVEDGAPVSILKEHDKTHALWAVSPAVERILAERLAAVQAERDEARQDYHYAALEASVLLVAPSSAPRPRATPHGARRGEVEARLQAVDFTAVLHAHRALANSPGDVVCACDRTWRPVGDYRAHLADVLRAALVIPTAGGER